MTQMLAFLQPQEITELRGYLERCVEGLESNSQRESADLAAERRRIEARSNP